MHGELRLKIHFVRQEIQHEGHFSFVYLLQAHNTRLFVTAWLSWEGLCVSSSVFVTVVEPGPSGLIFWAIIKQITVAPAVI
jgi:hypothetical protein